MGPIWIVCKHINIRKFYVYNLTVRGYLAIGMSDLTGQSNTFWPPDPPDLVILWSKLSVCEDNLRGLYRHYLEHIAVIVISNETPSREWLHMWHIAACLPELSDSRDLPLSLQPWLHHEAGFQA